MMPPTGPHHDAYRGLGEPHAGSPNPGFADTTIGPTGPQLGVARMGGGGTGTILGAMASDKRERQRQNRAVKEEEQSKVKRKQKTFATIKRVGVWIVVGVVLLGLANIVFG